MIDLYLLEELVAFARFGTLAATAQHLRVTQPTVTRGMQKIEEELGVKIFDRKPNRITLTETGKLAVQEAQKLIDAQAAFIETIQNFDRHHAVIRIASVAPGPLFLTRKLHQHFQIEQLDRLLALEHIEHVLTTRQADLVFSQKPLETPEMTSTYVGTEYLSVNVDNMVLPAGQTSLTFQDMNHMSFIVLSDIGVWKEIIHEQIPQATFLYQTGDESFTVILENSNLPYFVTNLSAAANHHQYPDTRRRKLDITDDTAQLDFFVTYRKEDENRLHAIISALQNAWSYDD
ncbi:LysR family transcriptional regulator [Streptococcus ruminantium]|uniref:LysR family transcriptional regulator n=1 Tax=Streptococcus ruminantium TaxID=1917441 RepID=UPI0012DFDC57|nr:LysR family transcriptional regulator [Streptococcus ruminantium]